MNASNDKAEFEMLVRPHMDALYRTALRMMRNHAVAEDMVQEACLRAFASFNQGDRKSNSRAWLFRILVNLCIDHLRAAGRRSTLPIDAIPPEAVPATDAPSPEQHAISRNLGDRLRAAIEALAPELRVVVLLILVEEMSYAEAAESLAVPVDTIRSRLGRARGRLQSLLGEHAAGMPKAAQASAGARVALS